MEDNKRYRVKRHEFGHGQSENMNPGRTETYGQNAFRGHSVGSNTGRDYEQNAGYRENYNRLGSFTEGIDTSVRRQKEEGPHRGKGPRSYRRTDDRILEEINDRLCDNPYLDATDIEVGIKEGEVVLTGVVNDRESKRLAEDIADEIPGVTNVENRLRVTIRGI